MKAVDILIDKLPRPLQRCFLLDKQKNILDYFFEEGSEDVESAYLVSMIATQLDTVESHNYASDIFHLALNTEETSYHIAYYHRYRILELEDFSNVESLKLFLEIIEEPDFDMVKNEQIEYVEEKLYQLDSAYQSNRLKNTMDIQLPDILDEEVIKNMKSGQYAFKDVHFGVTRHEFEEKMGQPTEVLINVGKKYHTVLYYRSRYKDLLVAAYFRGHREMHESDYIYTDVNYFYNIHYEISKKKFERKWGKPNQQGIAMGKKSYRYSNGNINLCFDKGWDNKYYVQSFWYGNDEAAREERERFVFEEH